VRSLKEILPLTLVVAFCAVAFAQGKSGWQLFHPQGSVFSVKIPAGTPKTQQQTFNDPKAGRVDMTMYFLVSGKKFYAMEDSKAQNTPTRAESPKILLDLQNGFIGTSGTTLVSAQPTTFKGYIARTMMFKKDNMLVRGLALMAGNHNLAFFATAESTKIKSAEVTNFFNSIKVNGK
jgi:hypothetical protein